MFSYNTKYIMNSSVSLENSEINNAVKQLYNASLKKYLLYSCEYGISIDKHMKNI